jgi:hypothetical protein
VGQPPGTQIGRPLDAALSFEGNWSATGTREVLDMGSGRQAATFNLSGSLILTSQQGFSRGFRSVASGFDDGMGLSVGECAWTDNQGDQVFSALRGQSVGSGKHIRGTITGGTGRYAGITGAYEFDWQYVILGSEGVLQGRAVGLKGTYQLSAKMSP